MSGSGEKSRRGLMLVVSSPSGAGKSTLCGRLLARHPRDLEMSVSATTRPSREGEEDGRHYHFMDKTGFERLRDQDGFLEWAKVFDNYYGTPRAPVEAALADGRDVLFDVDWQGAQQLTQKRAEDVVKVFILPPSKAELERRLRARASDPEEVVLRRMAKFESEVSHWPEYDYAIVNDDLDAADRELDAILRAERQRTRRHPTMAEFVNTMAGAAG